jgi:hypothetical protein
MVLRLSAEGKPDPTVGNRSSSWRFYDRWEAFWAFCVPHQPRPIALLKPEQVLDHLERFRPLSRFENPTVGNRSSSWRFYDRWEAFWAFCVLRQPALNALLSLWMLALALRALPATGLLKTTRRWAFIVIAGAPLAPNPAMETKLCR